MQHPYHSYAKSGIYTITITAEDSGGFSSSHTRTITIFDIHPEAGFTYAPVSPVTGETIEFTDTSIDQDGYIVNWTWDFGDGTTSLEQNATHTYFQSGIKTITLTVTDNTGNISSVSKRITVANSLPVAQFFMIPEKPEEGESIDFTDISSDDDGNIVSWHWDFGDGTASDQQAPQHVYEDSGTYTITLIVRDNDGGEDTTTQSITVTSANGTPGFTYVILLLAATIVIFSIYRKRKDAKL